MMLKMKLAIVFLISHVVLNEMAIADQEYQTVDEYGYPSGTT